MAAERAFTCEGCGEEFVTTDTPEDAKALYEERFGENWEDGKMKFYCDGCFEGLMKVARLFKLGLG